MNAPWKILLCLCIKHSAEEKSCYREELEEDMRYIRRRWTNNQENDYNILLYIRFRFGFVHLQHSNVSKLNTVCALHYKVYCAYTPSNGAMALLNKISVFSPAVNARASVSKPIVRFPTCVPNAALCILVTCRPGGDLLLNASWHCELDPPH